MKAVHPPRGEGLACPLDRALSWELAGPEGGGPAGTVDSTPCDRYRP